MDNLSNEVLIALEDLKKESTSEKVIKKEEMACVTDFKSTTVISHPFTSSSPLITASSNASGGVVIKFFIHRFECQSYYF